MSRPNPDLLAARLVSVVFITLLASVSFGCGSSGSSTPTPPPPVVPNAVVDFGASQQTIRGFGGSSAWIMDLNAHPVQADALYGNSGSQQIGLSILRVRIDPSPDPGGHANWATELGNAQQASARGAIVFASPWSPPAALKSNNDVNNGGELNLANYADYADYLESFITYMQNGGVNLYAVSMQNEPDWTATYESCRWTGDQMHDWVLDYSSVLTTRLIMPESLGFSPSLSDPTLNDPNVVGHTPLAIIGGHLYGTSPAAYPNAVDHGLDLWMTEHAVDGTGLTGALQLAKEIHDSMTVGNYNAYVYWWMQNWTVNNPSPYAKGFIDDPAQDNHLTLNGYVMGQFSKFIRPDYVRATATSNPSGSIYVSAYKGNGHHVIVALNLGSSSVSQTFVIRNQTVASMTPYRTSATENLIQLSVVSVANNSFSYMLPAQSITTLVE
jgi:glucuronoarabinoxylan endo-1,4-beta-xylanase